jgi:DNA-directed RNA polymerase delta subunit
MKTNQSMIEVATEILEESATPLTFQELWAGIAKRLEMSEEESASLIGSFYTDLSFCGNIIMIKKNKTWDLRDRHLVDEYHLDATEAYLDVEESSDRDDTDIQDEQEYNQSVLGTVGEANEDEVIDDENPDGSMREREAATEALGIKSDM